MLPLPPYDENSTLGARLQEAGFDADLVITALNAVMVAGAQ